VVVRGAAVGLHAHDAKLARVLAAVAVGAGRVLGAVLGAEAGAGVEREAQAARAVGALSIRLGRARATHRDLLGGGAGTTNRENQYRYRRDAHRRTPEPAERTLTRIQKRP